MSKKSDLETIALQISNCAICKQESIGIAVPGEGNPNADIVFMGEAPGKNEAKTGRPFIGRSGKFLRATIQEIGLKEEDVFITSPVKYLPERGTPNPKQIAHGREHLMEQLEVIKPKLIVLMGSVAAQGVIQEKIPVLKEHGKILKRDGKNYFLTIHPAAAIRFQKFRSVFKDDFQILKNELHSRL